MSMTLELSPTVELIEELARRFDSLVFNGMNRRDMETPDGHVNQVSAWRVKGDQYTCIGLAEAVKMRALNSLDEHTTGMSPEDL